ncbi:MFS transporter [Opitutus sp. ER46]|uniref:MFS transporter n=1 Tax=Opitutus sp. ER46 TaxID=2161864 RepID=UPI000D2FA104|nr:MFS transporter [Opitutus sp. ER46]PTX95704.1 MFS transporter [Opitutus sp. ER46]
MTNALRAQPAESLRPAYKWWVVGMLWFVCFFNYADRQAISSVLPLLAREFNLDDVALGWIGSAFAWVYAAAAPVAGLIADRRPRKILILVACVVWSFFTLATAWCQGVTALFVIRALTGLGETFYFPAAMSLLSDYHGQGTRSRAMSWHQSAVYAGTILGSWLAAELAERHGWRAPFWWFGPIGIVLALVLFWALREPRRGSSGAVAEAQHPAVGTTSLPIGQTLRLLFHTPVALLLMGAFLCANFVAVIFLTWTPKFLVEKFGYSLGSAGLTGTLYIHLASALVVPIAGWLADWLGARLRFGRILVQLIGLSVGAIFVFIVGHTESRVTLVTAMTLFGVCKGMYDSGIFAALYDAIEPSARGTAAGIMNTVGWAGGALGPLAVGIATRYGRHPRLIDNMSEAIALGSVVYVAGALLLGIAAWHRARHAE